MPEYSAQDVTISGKPPVVAFGPTVLAATKLPSPTMIRAVKMNWEAGGGAYVVETQEQPIVVSDWLIVVVSWLLNKTRRTWFFPHSRVVYLAGPVVVRAGIRINAETVRRGMRQMQFVWHCPRPVVGRF